jgi:hypothetical protein
VSQIKQLTFSIYIIRSSEVILDTILLSDFRSNAKGDVFIFGSTEGHNRDTVVLGDSNHHPKLIVILKPKPISTHLKTQLKSKVKLTSSITWQSPGYFKLHIPNFK